MTIKVCTNCRQSLAAEQFHHYGPNRSQVGNWCEPCYQKKKQQRKEKNLVQEKLAGV